MHHLTLARFLLCLYTPTHHPLLKFGCLSFKTKKATCPVWRVPLLSVAYACVTGTFAYATHSKTYLLPFSDIATFGVEYVFIVWCMQWGSVWRMQWGREASNNTPSSYKPRAPLSWGVWKNINEQLIQCTDPSTIPALFSFLHTNHVEWCRSVSQVTMPRLKGVSNCKSFVLTRQVQVFRPDTHPQRRSRPRHSNMNSTLRSC